MKIQTINSYLYNVIPLKNNYEKQNNRFLYNNLQTDVVSFTAKKYDADSIINQTNHCGYCGCKVYTENQLEGIAKEMLSSKSERLQGKIKSVLEKLEGAKNSDEIALAKRMENSDEIEFYKNFLDVSMKKPFLKGDAIFEQFYCQNSDEAIVTLKKKLHPLLKTVDHISPQNRDEENTHLDVNLLEACYCCNHDLKKGVSFDEFYTMFPSIEKNMPADKFKYATSNVLLNAQNGIGQRLSANNIIKSIQRLLLQRHEVLNNLNNIDSRISELNAQSTEAIKSMRADIEDKKAEIIILSSKLVHLSQDPEFSAIQEREKLQSSLINIQNTIEPLVDKKNNLSSAINQLQNPQKVSKKGKNAQKTDLSKEQRFEKIKELKQKLAGVISNIEELDMRKTDVELKITELNEKFPSIELLQSKKQHLDDIINVHNLLEKEKENLEDKKQTKSQLEFKINNLKHQIEESSFKKEQFDIDLYSKENQDIFKRYQSILEAVSFIDKHQNGGDINLLIRQSAKKQLEKEREALEKYPVIIDLHNSEKISLLREELENAEQELNRINNLIIQLEKTCLILESKASEKSKETAEIELKETIENINRYEKKCEGISISQKIQLLEAEVMMLENSIENLQRQKSSTQTLSKFTK